MRTFKYLRLFATSSGVFMRCTDKQTVDWIANEIKKTIPSCQIEESKTTFKLSRLQNQDIETGSFITQLLCQHGWEPFAVTPIYKELEVVSDLAWASADVLHFRYEAAT